MLCRCRHNVDNGSPYSGSELARTCAVLGIRLIHSKPYSPQGRGKQERLNRVIRERFLLEAEAAGIESLEQLNERFIAWCEQWLNCRIHRETGHAPIARFLAGGPARTVEPALLTEAFRWSALRRVTRTASVSLLGNKYQVDPALVGRRVEVRYDPEDLSSLSVLLEGRDAGLALPYILQHHTHPAVPQADRPAPAPTGVDFLGMVVAAHQEQTATAISFRKLNNPEVPS
ncbi:MAG: Mu transposase C-terminal domain-containing protein [Candidatus Dormibacteria bacterium]